MVDLELNIEAKIALFLLVGLAWIFLTVAICLAGESPLAFIVAQTSPLLIVHRLRGAPVSVRASWYGGGEYLNARTANGERFNTAGHTAAHRTLPFGTRLEVTNLATHLTTIVRINDRGPAARLGRDLDLSRAAAASIGMIGAGLAHVTYRILE